MSLVNAFTQTVPIKISVREKRLQVSTFLRCQLLGLNARNPTSFSFSFKGFSLRGGCTDVHCHGWGIAIYEGKKGLRLFLDKEPCSYSPIAELVSNLEIKTLNTIAHIRYATFGEVCLANVHPFQREIFGVPVTFAHNGDVPLFKNDHEAHLPWIGKSKGERIYNPVGDTDSEKIFCSLLNAIKAEFRVMPEIGELFQFLEETLNEIVEHDKESTILNFLMGIGSQYQFAYSWPGQRTGSKVWNGLYYVVREPPFKRTSLIDCDYELDFSKLAGDNDQVSIIATKPLTYNENWIEFERGQLILFDSGTPKLLKESNHIDFSLKEDRRRFNNSGSSGVSSFLGSCI